MNRASFRCFALAGTLVLAAHMSACEPSGLTDDCFSNVGCDEDSGEGEHDGGLEGGDPDFDDSSGAEGKGNGDSAREPRGMTWELTAHDDALGIDFVGCHGMPRDADTETGSCDAYDGDTLCSTELHCFA